jgi:hypothetical protein
MTAENIVLSNPFGLFGCKALASLLHLLREEIFFIEEILVEAETSSHTIRSSRRASTYVVDEYLLEADVADPVMMK